MSIAFEHCRITLRNELNHSRASSGAFRLVAISTGNARNLTSLASAIQLMQEDCKPAADEEKAEDHCSQYEKPEPIDIPGLRVWR